MSINKNMIAVSNMKGLDVVISQEPKGVLLRELDEVGEVTRWHWLPYEKIGKVVDRYFAHGFYEVFDFEYPEEPKSS